MNGDPELNFLNYDTARMSDPVFHWQRRRQPFRRGG